MIYSVAEHVAETPRHTTFYLAAGAAAATPIIFVHGWPELSISWRHQLPCFAGLGFRAVAPDMRGYGRSSVYARHEDYALEHDRRRHDRAARRARRATRRSGSATTGAARSCGASPAIIPDRCHGVANLCVPYFAEGFAPDDAPAAGRPRASIPRRRVSGRAVGLPALLPGELRQGARGLRGQRPQHREGALPQGQPAAARASPRAPRRSARDGGWFGGAGQAPDVPLDTDVLTEEDMRQVRGGAPDATASSARTAGT